jgi:DNA invertase Pin-like site-specific DNA recombinase
LRDLMPAATLIGFLVNPRSPITEQNVRDARDAAERAMIRERVLAGLARARQTGTHLGRKFTEDTKDGSRKIKAALAMRAKGFGYRKIAREVGLGVGTVMRLTAATEQTSRPFEGASVAAA